MPSFLNLKGPTNPTQRISVQDNIRQAVTQVRKKNTQKDDCGWQGQGANDLYYVTRSIPIGPGTTSVADYVVNLPKAYKKFMLVSISPTSLNNSLYFHLNPIGNQYTDTGITPSGRETWFSMKVPSASGDTTYVQALKFAKPVNQFYLDVGYEDGAGSSPTVLTIMCWDEDFDFSPLFGFDQLA